LDGRVTLMWDALRTTLTVSGLFGFGKKKPKEVAPAPAAPEPEPVMAKVEEKPAAGTDVKFRGLHPDTNPSQSVRPASMTCQSCGHQFRYFVNSNGQKTVTNCPG